MKVGQYDYCFVILKAVDLCTTPFVSEVIFAGHR